MAGKFCFEIEKLYLLTNLFFAAVAPRYRITYLPDE